MIDVVSGAIIRSGRIFLTQRKHMQSYAHKWESAGGKRNPGESLRDALGRELDEELEWVDKHGCKPVIAPEPFMVAEFAGSDGREDKTPIMLHFFEVTVCPTVWPISRENNGSGWFGSTELAVLPLLPGNERALPYLLEMMRHSL